MLSVSRSSSEEGGTSLNQVSVCACTCSSCCSSYRAQRCRGSGAGSYGRPGIILLIKILLENQEDVHLQTGGGWSAMHYAISRNVEGIARLLHGAGADINAKCTGGKTPLHYACETRKIRCAKELVNLGASITITNEGRRSPLCLAVAHGEDELVSPLLQCGAKPTSYIDKNKWKIYKNEHARILQNQGFSDPLKRQGSPSTVHTRQSVGSAFSVLSSGVSRKSNREG